jgi:hypothetical protein
MHETFVRAGWPKKSWPHFANVLRFARQPFGIAESSRGLLSR